MKSLIFRYWIFSFVLIFTISCKKENPPKKNIPNYEEALLVLNEGNFMSGNSTLTLISNEDSVQEDVFRIKNGFALGDVGQSLYEFKNYIYLVVNNSNKIFRLDKDFKVTGTLAGLQSPRYFLPINDTIALVTDLYANGIHVVHIPSFTKIQFINIQGWTENMLFYQNKIWVANPFAKSLYIINPKTMVLEDSLVLQGSYGAMDLVVDISDNLWALCYGNSSMGIYPSLVKIKNGNILQTFTFSSGSYPSRLSISRDKSYLCWINNGIYIMPHQDNELPKTAFIEQGSRNFYHLFIHPNKDEIWVADAKDYVQKGEVLKFSFSSGELLKTFKVGIIPGFMLYLRK
jgi:hypothetical protein